MRAEQDHIHFQAFGGPGDYQGWVAARDLGGGRKAALPELIQV